MKLAICWSFADGRPGICQATLCREFRKRGFADGMSANAAQDTKAVIALPGSKYRRRCRSCSCMNAFSRPSRKSVMLLIVGASSNLFAGSKSSRFNATIPKSKPRSICAMASDKTLDTFASEYSFLHATPTFAPSNSRIKSGSPSSALMPISSNMRSSSSSQSVSFAFERSRSSKLMLPFRKSLR